MKWYRYSCGLCGNIQFEKMTAKERKEQSAFLPCLCKKCRWELLNRKNQREYERTVQIYTGKMLPRYEWVKYAASDFKISEDRFRKLRNDGLIPGFQDGYHFMVDTYHLNNLVLNGTIPVYPVGKKILSDKERQERKKASQQKYRLAHKEQANLYVCERKQNDPVFKLKSQARNAIYQSFARTGNVKSRRCEDITGLSIDLLYAYLIGTYKDNYGTEWDGSEPVHIDHIIPLATAKTEEDVIRLCHYTNLQLLTAKDNLKKGSAYANC